jgi:hypothetical protein
MPSRHLRYSRTLPARRNSDRQASAHRPSSFSRCLRPLPLPSQHRQPGRKRPPHTTACEPPSLRRQRLPAPGTPGTNGQFAAEPRSLRTGAGLGGIGAEERAHLPPVPPFQRWPGRLMAFDRPPAWAPCPLARRGSLDGWREIVTAGPRVPARASLPRLSCSTGGSSCPHQSGPDCGTGIALPVAPHTDAIPEACGDDLQTRAFGLFWSRL